MRRNRDYFQRSTKKVGKDLLGDYLVVNLQEESIKAKIIETEIYVGPEDQASHTRNANKTKRNKVVWKPGGHVYVYLTYGIHWMLNIVTEKEDVPECALIRAVNVDNLDFKKTNGPGKLTKKLGIDKSLYGEDLTKSSKIWIEQGKDEKIAKTPRINIDSAGEPWVSKKWRFLIVDYKNKLPKP